MTRWAQGSGPAGLLIGRAAESEALRSVIGRVQDGSSGALVVVGEAGIGKSALLKDVADGFPDVRFVVAVGTESEQPLAYAGLQQLLSLLLDEVELLPVPQRTAVKAAFGLESGSVPDRFLLGIAALTLLAGAARERPLVVVVDDAQWWDAESCAALGFVGRRVEEDSLGLLVTVRADPDAEPVAALAGWPVLPLLGLDPAASRKLLTDRHGDISPAVLRRLSDGTGGNPLALITVAAWLSADQRSGHRPLPDPLPVGRHLEQLFSAQVRSLPDPTGQLLLLAAAASGEPAVFWKACALLGLSADVIDPAVQAGIVRSGAEVTFSHPLVRSAVYADASPVRRRRVHAALAAATDVHLDPDRHSWHLAAATSGPDEQVAAALERSSERAADRGGHTARAAYLRRAGELSVDAALRSSRLLAAAQAYYLSGDPVTAQVMLLDLPDQLPGALAADRDHLQMMVEIAGGRPHAVASIILRNLEAHGGAPSRQSRDALFEALHAVILTGRFGTHQLGVRVATAALSAVRNQPGPIPTTSADLLLEAFATRMVGDYPTAVALLRKAVADGGAEWPTSGITFYSMNIYAYTELWEVHSERELLQGMAHRLRAQGALSGLVMILLQLGGLAVRDGSVGIAEAHYAEASGLLHSLGSPGPELYTTLHLAWQGREAELRTLAAVADTVFGPPLSVGLVLGVMNYSVLILELSLGRYEQALVQANLLFAEDSPATGSLCLPAMVEAASRSGDPVTARAALDRLSSRADAVDNTYVRGMLSRSAALLSPDSTAEQHYLAALEDLGAGGTATDLAWAHLLYGEWLRRRKRRSAARIELRISYEAFEAMGARLWADRARRELIATGARLDPGPPSVGSPTLTSQEANIAALAAAGHTNQEIATQLFIGTSTVEYHLTKIFRKHQLTSRRQLRRLVPQPVGPVADPTPG